MKKTLFIFSALIIFFGTVNAQSLSEKWPEVKAFHSVMSNCFHSAEDGNLEPIKERIGEMVEAAGNWLKSTPPEGLESDEITKLLTKLYEGCAGLQEYMNSEECTDEGIVEMLEMLHDVFHEVVGACNPNDEHEH